MGTRRAAERLRREQHKETNFSEGNVFEPISLSYVCYPSINTTECQLQANSKLYAQRAPGLSILSLIAQVYRHVFAGG